MRRLFRSGGIAQFVLHGDVFDVVPGPSRQLFPLKAFLDDVLFPAYDVILHYDCRARRKRH